MRVIAYRIIEEKRILTRYYQIYYREILPANLVLLYELDHLCSHRPKAAFNLLKFTVSG
jgi:hypothetical protein